MAEWKPVEDFPSYMISDDGQIKNTKFKKERILKQFKNKCGHMEIGLHKNGTVKCLKVHRLMAEAFIPNPNNYPIVRHLNDIPNDNRLDNLAWGTQKDNMQDSVRNGTHCAGQRKPVIAIKDGKSEYFISQKEAEKAIGVPQANISACVLGKYKQCNGYKFVSPKPRHAGKPKPWNSK
jgi:hypothetical protein